MHLKKRAEIILDFSKALFVNGESTQVIVDEMNKLAAIIHLDIKIMINWGEIFLEAQDKLTLSKTHLMIKVKPTNIHMGRVVDIMNLIKKIHEQEISIEKAHSELPSLETQPPAPTWQFVLASGFGAVALGVGFGLNHWLAAFLIFLSASFGAIIRRYLAKVTSNLFIQPFSAAFIAGVIGALTMGESSTLRLITLCPCMVLMPGPHFLNAFLDLIQTRLPLGISRLIYAVLICLAIISGLLLGINSIGGSIPVSPNNQVFSPLVWNIVAAGFAIFAYNIFFSTPIKICFWPVLVGMLAHIILWIGLILFHANLINISFLACFWVGLSLSWICYKKYLPFAAGGFSSVVSMIPGVYLFRMASGISQMAHQNQMTFELLSDTFYQGMMAGLIMFAIALGLLIPKVCFNAYFFKNKS